MSTDTSIPSDDKTYPVLRTLEEIQDYAATILAAYNAHFTEIVAEELVENPAAAQINLWLSLRIPRHQWEYLVCRHLDALGEAGDTKAQETYLDHLEEFSPGIRLLTTTEDMPPTIDLPPEDPVPAPYFGVFDRLKDYKRFQSIVTGFGLRAHLYVSDQGDGTCGLRYVISSPDGTPIRSKIFSRPSPGMALN
jgi:hypothetical protein